MGENRVFVFLDRDLVDFIMASSCTHVADLREIFLAKQFPLVYIYHVYYLLMNTGVYSISWLLKHAFISPLTALSVGLYVWRFLAAVGPRWDSFHD